MYCNVKNKIVRSIAVCGIIQLKRPNKLCKGCDWFKNPKVISAAKKDNRYKKYIKERYGDPPYKHQFFVPLFVQEYLLEQAYTNDCLVSIVIRKIMLKAAKEKMKMTILKKTDKNYVRGENQ